MNERLRSLLKEKKLSASQFADAIGVQRSSISHILSGRNKPSIDFLRKLIITFPDVDAAWLISGNKSNKKPARIIPKVPLDDDSLKESSEQDSSKPGVVTSQAKEEIKLEDSKPPVESGNGDKNISQIVIFYTDNTFIRFTPGA